MTSPDLLYRTADVVAAAVSMLGEQIPDSVAVQDTTLDDPVPDPPYLLLNSRSPALTGPMMGGDQQARHTLTLLAVGTNAAQAKMLGDLARMLILGRDPKGAFLHDIDLQDRQVIQREGGTDGAGDNPGGVAQWAENYTLLVVRTA